MRKPHSRVRFFYGSCPKIEVLDSLFFIYPIQPQSATRRAALV